jgi:hypothetical protein
MNAKEDIRKMIITEKSKYVNVFFRWSTKKFILFVFASGIIYCSFILIRYASLDMLPAPAAAAGLYLADYLKRYPIWRRSTSQVGI